MKNEKKIWFRVFGKLSGMGLLKWVPDDLFLKVRYRGEMNKPLNLRNPQTFNEKLQWLKLYDRKPEYTVMVDKYAAKQYVAAKIGEQYIIPTLGVWEHFDDIDFDSLPNQFVLKCTHDSGGLVVCKDKSSLDKTAAREKIEKSLKQNYYWSGREWPYKNVPPRIIAEKYMSNNQEKDNEGTSLKDYKFYSFNGEPQYLYISDNMDDHKKARISFATMEWEKAPFGRTDYHEFKELPEKPKHFEDMVKLVRVLSEDHSFLRVDLYEINNNIYFGELTFHPCAGFMPFKPEEWDNRLGQLITLPERGGVLICNDGYSLWIHPEKDCIINENNDLKDYKFYCFNGTMKFVMVNSDRNSDKPTKADYFDRDFNWLDFTWGYAHAEIRPEKPEKFEEMVFLAEKLSKGLSHIRVDFYECDGKVYFGELTFYDGSGFDAIEPIEWDYKIGKLIKIPL